MINNLYLQFDDNVKVRKFETEENEFNYVKNIGIELLKGKIEYKENLMYTPLELYDFLQLNNISLCKTICQEDYYWFQNFEELFPENIIESYVLREEDLDGNRIGNIDHLSFDKQLLRLKLLYPDYTEEDIMDILYDKVKECKLYNYDRAFVESLSQIPRFCGKFLNMYAIEDCFDQIIAYMVKELNINIIIFEQMIGSHGFVKEVFDCRDRQISFESLIFT